MVQCRSGRRVAACCYQEDSVRLEDLRPAGGVDLLALKRHLDTGDWRASVPSSFSDQMLLQLAFDFREVEEGLHRGFGAELAGFAPALATTMSLVLKHPKQARGSEKDLQISEPALMALISTYQWGLEREIVQRIIGLARGDETDLLLSAVWKDKRG